MSLTRNRVLALGAVALFAAVLAGVLVVGGRDAEPEINLPTTVDQGIETMNTTAFARLPDYRQEAYRQEVHQLIRALPEPQRQALFLKYRDRPDLDQVLRRLKFNPLQNAAEEYFRAGPEGRTAVLDKLIDQMEWFRGVGGLLGRAAPAERPTAGLPDADLRARIRDQAEAQIQEGNPQETAQTLEFMKQLRLRRQERGLPGM